MIPLYSTDFLKQNSPENLCREDTWQPRCWWDWRPLPSWGSETPWKNGRRSVATFFFWKTNGCRVGKTQQTALLATQVNLQIQLKFFFSKPWSYMVIWCSSKLRRSQLVVVPDAPEIQKSAGFFLRPLRMYCCTSPLFAPTCASPCMGCRSDPNGPAPHWGCNLENELRWFGFLSVRQWSQVRVVRIGRTPHDAGRV